MVRTLIFVLCLSWAGSGEAREPPAAQCVDARRIADAHQLDAQTMLLRTAGGIRARATLASACPDIFADGDARLLAPEGWLCGGPHDAVVSQTQRCAVTAVEHIDAGNYAELLQRTVRLPRCTPSSPGGGVPAALPAPPMIAYGRAACAAGRTAWAA